MASSFRLPSILLLAAFLFGAGLAAPTSALAQPSPNDVLRSLGEAYDDQFGQVDTYVLVTSMGGDMSVFDSLRVYARRTPAGTFETSTEAFGGMADFLSGQDLSGAQNDLMELNKKLLDNFLGVATYQGRESVNGVDTYVMEVTDPEALASMMAEQNEAVSAGMGGEEDMQLESARLFVDTERSVLAKMEMRMQVDSPDVKGLMTMEMEMSDYRQVGPLLYPFRMVNRMNTPISDELRKEMEAQQAEMKKELAGLPPEQRKQMEEMMNMAGGMMAGAMDGTVEMVMEVQRLEVNVPLPADAFK
ncbi:MAG: hypothetical protein AAF970_09890 [Bacteroidota bacterium]